MKNDNNKNIIIALLVFIIVILGALVVLFATETIIIKSSIKDSDNQSNEAITENNNNNELSNENIIEEENNEVTSNAIYSNFLNTKGYLNDFSKDGHEVVGSVNYTYYDLDNNGTEELIIYLSDGADFGTNLFYTYVGDEIKFIDKIYHFGNLTYNTVDGNIVYTEVRPSLAYGYAYGFYKLNNNKFELVKSVGVSIENGENTYFVDDKNVTKDEYDKSFKDNISFEYNELNN